MKKLNMGSVKEYFSSKSNKRKVGIIGLLIILLAIIIIPASFAQLTPVASVTVPSVTLSYANGDEGSWQFVKSAKWISRGKARITIELDTLVKPKNDYTDVILVLDTSGSMVEGRLSQVKSDVNELINDTIPKGNKIALITFNTTSEIITDFTDDSTLLQESINNLTATGNTNYYQALVNVDNILKNYQSEINRDCVVLFLTDGLPNVETPNEVAQYAYLKTTYPYLTINGIQYEMGDTPLSNIKSITDNQYIANTSTLNKFLYRAAVSPVQYDTFELTDYIYSDYFNVSDVSSIASSTGTVSLEDENGTPKVIWNLNGLTSGSEAELIIDINLNEDLIGVGGIYPTNERESVNYQIGSTSTTETSASTPVLADNYLVSYDSNAPDSCEVSNMPESKNASVFDTVKIGSDTEPVCEGYKFKEWQLVTEDVTQVNADYFIMPEANVTVRATWSKLSVNKSMEGTISKVQSLYQMMADNSVADNVASEYVTNSAGIKFNSISSDTNGKGIYQDADTASDEYPIYYYRGAVTNNNLVFANFCWKIVRTTETGGVKLIYNGVPNDDGSCTATGTAAQLSSTSAFNSSYNSLAYNGYMYGDVYSVKNTNTSIVGMGGKSRLSKSSQSETNYIYSSTVTYDETTGLYTLVNGENRAWSDTYSTGTGNQYLYTCFSETENTCSTVGYVVQSTSSSYIYYVSLTGGETAEDTMDKELVYGNDVIYDETTGLYTLQTTMTSTIRNWETDRTTIGGTNGYHYTCLNETGTCSTVKYINYISAASTRSYGTMYYVELSNGIKIEEAVKKMTTESELTTNSKIKTAIDTWYESNMTEYTNKLENTIWCNDRTIGQYGTWDKDGSATSYLYYQKYYDVYSNYSPILTCRNANDAYTLSVETGGTEGYGNNKLKYPVALLTADEIMLAGGRNSSNSTYYLYTGQYWWSLSPRYFDNYRAYGFNVYSNGYLYYSNVYYSYGVRPSVSLAPGTKSIDGEGTPESPYIVE